MWTKPIDLDNPFATHHFMSASKNDDLFGIEVELEGRNIILPSSDKEFYGFWATHNDGSLRDGRVTGNPDDRAIEYVFRRGLTPGETEKALELLQERLTAKNVVVNDSGRTSVHVHVNMLNEKLSTVYNFITLAIIFDELFVSQNGFHRIGNNFCFRFKDAEASILDMANSISSHGDLSRINPNNRYCSVNICSLFKFGTIEFRSLECTVRKERIWAWCRTVQALKEAARKFDNPMDIITQFSLLGVERFYLQILGVHAIPYARVQNRHSMLFEGVRLAQDFANASNWNKMSLKDWATKTQSHSGVRVEDVLNIRFDRPARGAFDDPEDNDEDGTPEPVEETPEEREHREARDREWARRREGLRDAIERAARPRAVQAPRPAPRRPVRAAPRVNQIPQPVAARGLGEWDFARAPAAPDDVNTLNNFRNHWNIPVR